MSCYRARWVLPIASPAIANGWIDIAQGRVAAVGDGRPPRDAEDLGDVAVLPGLVNAHTHLELSWLAGRVPPAPSMDAWIQSMMGVRRAGPAGGLDEERAAARDAAAAMRAQGTILAGDISNALFTPRILADAGIGGIVFHELLGFSPADPSAMVRDAWGRIRDQAQALGPCDPPIAIAAVAHAPYSVAPALFAAILRAANQTPLAIHLAESREEIELIHDGTGPLRQMLERFGVWNDAWPVPGCDPVQYLEQLGYLRPGTLVVHAVHVTADGLERLRRAHVVIVTCPRSNEWVGAGVPPIARFYASGVPVAIGTDSLASTSSLGVFEELAAMRRMAPEVSAAALLDSATRVGAEALGLGRDFGTVQPGKRAALIAVRIPRAVTDVEEYLVNGVAPADIRWVARPDLEVA